MRTAIVTNPGSAEAIEIVDRPDPVPEPSEVVIAVEAATVNPVDLQTRAGVYHSLGWVSSAEVGLGCDAVGTVIEKGGEVDGIRVGDRVAVFIGGVDRGFGAYAERVSVPARDVARVPADLSSAHAATVPLNATTASAGLDLLGEAQGRSLLVTGAAGAVGGFALELARERGFSVTGLARAEDAEFVTATGAAFVADLADAAAFDAAFDAAAIGDAVVASVRDGGAYVGVIPVAVPASDRGISVQAVMAGPDGALLGRLLSAAAKGTITARVHAMLPLERAADAHQQFGSGGVRGRIVLLP